MDVPHADNDLFQFHPVSYAEVRKVVMALPSNKAPGDDKVPVSVKHCLEKILPTITHLLSRFFHEPAKR